MRPIFALTMTVLTASFSPADLRGPHTAAAASASHLVPAPNGTAQSVQSLSVAPPAPIATLDPKRMKGEPTKLAWSPDGAQLFIETNERNRGVLSNPHYYLLAVEGGKVSSIDSPPAWAGEYWNWKSYPSAPGSASTKIDVDERDRRNTATATPMGGDLARGAPSAANGTSVDDAHAAALQSDTQHVITLRLQGEVVGEYVNQQFVPGYTFGWAPKSSGTFIAYSNRDGHLTLMDGSGKRTEVSGTRNVLLPAWSDDGSKIAFVQKDGKKFDVLLAQVK